MVILSFIAGGLLMFFGIYFGLKWQIKLSKGENITLPEIKPQKMKEEPLLSPELVKEWFEGKKEGE